MKEKKEDGKGSSSSDAQEQFCRFDIMRLLGIKSKNTGKLFECTMDNCKHSHFNKLDDIPKTVLTSLKNSKRSGQEMKDAIGKHLLNSK